MVSHGLATRLSNSCLLFATESWVKPALQAGSVTTCKSRTISFLVHFGPRPLDPFGFEGLSVEVARSFVGVIAFCSFGLPAFARANVNNSTSLSLPVEGRVILRKSNSSFISWTVRSEIDFDDVLATARECKDDGT